MRKSSSRRLRLEPYRCRQGYRLRIRIRIRLVKVSRDRTCGPPNDDGLDPKGTDLDEYMSKDPRVSLDVDADLKEDT